MDIMYKYVGRDSETKEKKEQNKKIVEEDDRELADIIYIFVSPDKPGIKFYSHSPKSALHFGTFETDRASISKVKWDDKVNTQDGAALFRVRDGSVTVKTYIVSIEQMESILDSIIKQKNNDKIIINVVEDKLALKKGAINLDNYNVYQKVNTSELSNEEYESKINKYFEEYNKVPDENTDGIGWNNFKSK